MVYTMQVVLVAFAAVVLGVGFLSTNHTQTSDEQLTGSGIPLVKETVLGKENSSPSPTTSVGSLSGYVYPGATVTSTQENYMELTSTADTDAISDWYKQLLKDNDFSNTNSVKTTTNGVVSNKLIGNDGGVTIEVDVSKDDSSSTALITVRKK